MLATCFLETAASVENPFVAGMTLSAVLSKAFDEAPQGERRKLRSLHNKVDNLLLEILERLPQTVEGFVGDMAGCAAVFEPEVEAGDAKRLLGPLWMVMQSRRNMETFCTQPIIVDFLTRRFTHGLPNILDAKPVGYDPKYPSMTQSDHLARADAPSRNYSSLSEARRKLEDRKRRERCLVIDVRDKMTLGGRDWHGGATNMLLCPGQMLQGINPRGGDVWSTSLSILPGGQFLSAGLAAMPDAFYRVPAMRMALDVIAYLGMLTVFSTAILFHDGGPLTVGKIVLAFYVLVSLRRYFTCAGATAGCHLVNVMRNGKGIMWW